MTFHFRPAKRENTPLIIGLAGPTKSGKTFSAHRLAAGLADGSPVAMINAEGAKGHQYSDRFTYLAADIEAPFRPERYTEALKVALALDPRPAVVIIDSGSHMHDGPGGILAYHEDELDRLAGQDMAKRQRATYTAWVKPKAAENEFIYEMLGADCHIILCLRAKEKIKIVKGQPPVDLGWQPIMGERVAFETLFTLMLPPRSKGVPDLALSEMREPFDAMIPTGQPLSEETGQRLRAWAAGPAAADDDAAVTADRRALFGKAREAGLGEDGLRALVKEVTGLDSTAGMTVAQYREVLSKIAEPESKPDGGSESVPADSSGSAVEAGAADRAASAADQPEGEPLFQAPDLRPDRERGE